MKSGKILLALSIITRLCVLIILVLLPMWNQYLNYKGAYNNPRLVELDAGKPARIFYELSDSFFSLFGDPEKVMQSNGGMTWSIRLMGVPFTDPLAATSVLIKNHQLELGFALGLILPLILVLLFGRVFCSYICPASLIFFSIAQLRKMLARYLYFPEIKMGKSMAWGVMLGTLILVLFYGHGVWSLVLPYFAVGQTIFHSIIFSTISATVVSLAFFVFVDLVLGRQFTCRYLCPTGRLLGFLGRRSIVTIKREEKSCLDSCQSCHDVCPMDVNPKIDITTDCSLCGECLVVCPSQCLKIGFRK
jgi:ferredoxin-type protein NapH